MAKKRTELTNTHYDLRVRRAALHPYLHVQSTNIGIQYFLKLFFLTYDFEIPKIYRNMIKKQRHPNRPKDPSLFSNLSSRIHLKILVLHQKREKLL